ncbi:hypothetical protein [Pseudomonas helleri]|uniref:hypothetical protein n=1 Tax=Pseudomonas helleri TaxID=1608996 RepID=UPI003C6DE46C
MDKSTKLILVGSFVILMSLPGPLSLIIYQVIISYNSEYSLSLNGQKSNLGVILATYAFTMLGFLAAVVAILLNFSQSQTFKKYKKNHYLDVFFCIYFLCMISLAATFILSILSLSSAPTTFFMRAALAISINTLAQVSLISVIIINICRKSL